MNEVDLMDDRKDQSVWYAQVNDIVGGWIVTDLALPMSAHDFGPNGDPAKRGYIIAECMTALDARTIASLLNQHSVIRARGSV